MRLAIILVAAYAFTAWNDAQAACQRFKPDGTVEACQHIAPGVPRVGDGIPYRVDRVEGRDAASSRRVPSHDGLGCTLIAVTQIMLDMA